MFTCLQISHIHQTHQHLSQDGLESVCTHCGIPLTELHTVEYQHYGGDHITFYLHNIL
jgi:hypothetical protein